MTKPLSSISKCYRESVRKLAKRHRPVINRYVWLEEARSDKPEAKWRPVKDGIVRLRCVRVMMETKP